METQYISLNMTPSGVNPIFYVSQYDVGRVLGFYVYNGSEIVDLDDYTCTVEATRTDGTQITANVITDNNSGVFAVTAIMSNVADKYNCQLVIVGGNSARIASIPFVMDVVTAPLNGNASSIYDDRSLYQQYNAATQAALANEANIRENADTTLQNNINQVQTNLNNVSGTLRANINNVSGTLQYMINSIYNKYQKNNVVVIGDSFCGDWYSFPKKSWAHRLKDLIGADNFRIYSYGGAGYVGKDNVNAKTYQQNFDDYIKPAYSNTKDSVTLVILSGGVNDTGYNPSYSDEYTAAINLIKDVKSFFTNAKIVGLNNVSLNKISRNVVCGINWAFDFMGVPNTTFGMSWLLGKTDYFLEDNLHPNDNGQEFIANKFYSFLLTGNDSVADRYNFISDGVAGGLIWSIENYTLTIFASGSLTKALSGNSFTFPSKLPSSIAPSHTISIPVYSDAGVGTCLYITNDGTVQLIQLGTTSLQYGFGSYRVDVMLNLNDK